MMLEKAVVLIEEWNRSADWNSASRDVAPNMQQLYDAECMCLSVKATAQTISATLNADVKGGCLLKIFYFQ